MGHRSFLKLLQTQKNLGSLGPLFTRSIDGPWIIIQPTPVTQKPSSRNPSISHFHQAHFINPHMTHCSFYRAQTVSQGHTFNKILIFQFSRIKNMRVVMITPKFQPTKIFSLENSKIFSSSSKTSLKTNSILLSLKAFSPSLLPISQPRYVGVHL